MGGMQPIVECVPNFSEGRDAATIAAIVAAMDVPGAVVLNVTSDADHNRSVVTLAGSPAAVSEAMFRAIRVAINEIDMRQHTGVHPRIGAADVTPFVSLQAVTMDECIALAEALGERVGRELETPVYLYGRAARRASRVRLADVRRGEYERWVGRVERDPDWAPDFGPARATAWGACAIGARDILIAYNLYLDTADETIAMAIAREIRESSGGLAGVQAKAFIVRHQAQVSMNATDIIATPLHVVQDAVKAAAARLGVAVVRSEVVGLLPQSAVLAAGRQYLGLEPQPGVDTWEALLLERQLFAHLPGFVGRIGAME